MSRIRAFEHLASHAWLGKGFAKLSQADLKLCREFLIVNENMSTAEFEQAVNRMFVDKAKPKNFTLILELLACANTEAHK